MWHYGRVFVFRVFIGAVSGAAWGLWQTAFDAQGDRRAHLLHRPLSPSWIFIGKLLTGAGLYLVAMSLPLAVYGMWTAMPGHMPAPFRWQALLPWLADILTGVVYYSAGTLMGVRPGRWYGSRCLGIPAALLCTFLVWNVPEFWHALVAIVTIGGLIAVAAWGSFLSGGSLDQQPRAAKAALACTYLMGLIVVSVEAKVIAESLIVPADAHHRSQYYAWDREGRLMVVHQLGKDGFRLTDIAGRESKNSSAIPSVQVPSWLCFTRRRRIGVLRFRPRTGRAVGVVCRSWATRSFVRKTGIISLTMDGWSGTIAPTIVSSAASALTVFHRQASGPLHALRGSCPSKFESEVLPLFDFWHSRMRCMQWTCGAAA